MNAREIAQASADAMWSTDGASQWLGMRLIEVDEGQATMTLQVERQHCNGFGMGHGGITFSLADSAFAFACNSRNVRTVAQHNSISYLAPAMLGDTLTATAREVSLTGRSGIYDVTITNQEDKKIAEFRGNSRAIGGNLFEPEESAP